MKKISTRKLCVFSIIFLFVLLIIRYVMFNYNMKIFELTGNQDEGLIVNNNEEICQYFYCDDSARQICLKLYCIKNDEIIYSDTAAIRVEIFDENKGSLGCAEVSMKDTIQNGLSKTIFLDNAFVEKGRWYSLSIKPHDLAESDKLILMISNEQQEDKFYLTINQEIFDKNIAMVIYK